MRHRMTVRPTLAGAERIRDGQRTALQVAKVHREECVRRERRNNRLLVSSDRRHLGSNGGRLVGKLRLGGSGVNDLRLGSSDFSGQLFGGNVLRLGGVDKVLVL